MNGSKPYIQFRFICAVVVFWMMPLLAFPQYFEFINGRHQQTISFKLIRNLVVIPLYINGQGPFNFILDTGVSPIIVIDTALRENLGEHLLRNIKISGYGGFDSIDAYLGHTTVKVGQTQMNNMPTVFLKDNILSLSGYMGTKIHGLLGYYFFNSFIVKIDYTNKTLKYSSYLKKRRKIKGEKISFELIENKPYISLIIEQHPLPPTHIKALVDCGANHTLSLESFQNKQFPLPEHSIEANLGIGLTREVKGRIGRVSSLKMGGHLFKDVLCSYPLYNIDSLENKQRNANIGAEILSRFNVTYDYRNLCMYVKKNHRFHRPFEHDMSGLELYYEPSTPTRTLISRIDPESPAQLADLQENDEIISINFKNTRYYTPDEIGEILKAKKGYFVILEVRRNNAYITTVLKLKKRI